MRRSVIAVVAGVAALGLSIPLALLGRAVLATPDRVEAARTPGGEQEKGSSFDHAADWLLGVEGSGPFVQLVQEYRQAIAPSNSSTGSGTPVRLATLARRVKAPSEQAQAHLMVGTVFVLPAGNGSISFGRLRQFGGGRLLAQAEDEFRAAAHLDDGNEAAKYDLELVLASQTAPFSALSGRRQTPANRPALRNRHQGQDARHTRTRRKLKQGGIYGSGSGY
jgi:hypothetical protein